MSEPSEAPLPDTMEGLRRQNSAYRALCASLEATQAIHTAEGRKYQEAVTSLDSEREANAILTGEIEALRSLVKQARDHLADGYVGKAIALLDGRLAQ